MQKVLAVDDDANMLEFYRQILTEAGYEFVKARDFASAIEIYTGEKPDLLILDADFPGGGDRAVITFIRETLEENTPALFITGFPDKLAAVAGMNNITILKKPMGPSAILEAVARLVNSAAIGRDRSTRKKILAVDDDLFILELYKGMLGDAGFEVHTAEDSVSAMTRFGEVKPDLVILDVDMPGGGGRKVFERLRKTMMSPTPIIFATGTPESVQGEARASAVSVLKKPLTPQTLIGEIKRLLKMADV
ncbi:MAG: response regulator [Elusimicrobiales bacterium]|nr:response regulator [Elusimicrobiales bacterium]